MIKLLIGGSPCTRWSIAQTKNRETEPSGIGWELFENYLIALEKFRPDFFLYENNKSMSKAIRDEITRRFGFEPICINSSKLSAQNRQRLYWCGKRNPDGTYSRVDVQQPEDRGILLRDVLESGAVWNEKGYTLKANYYKSSPANALDGGHYPAPMSAEPVRIGTIESGTSGSDWDSKQYRVYSPDGKSVTLCGQGGGVGAKTGLYTVPTGCDVVFTENSIRCQRRDAKHSTAQGTHVNFEDGKSSALTQVESRRMVAVPQEYDVYQESGFTEAYCLRYERTEEAKRLRKAYEAGEVKHGYHELHELHPRLDGKTNTLTTVQKDNMIIERSDGKTTPVYEVQNGLITIKDKQYPIKLADGFYIIRKLTVTECKRLQTVPESYVFPVSDTQAYKMLGNGWTVDVITHILSHCQGITDEPLDVLSMYDGMACGHIALDKLGAQIARYRATEIDKYAIKTACHNFPDIIQLGDAFQVREWE